MSPKNGVKKIDWNFSKTEADTLQHNMAQYSPVPSYRSQVLGILRQNVDIFLQYESPIRCYYVIVDIASQML